jgi:hypothetical protein
MEPKDEIDDTAYFKTLRAQEEGEGAPFRATLGGITKWTTELDANFVGPNFWRAAGRITREPGDWFRDFNLPEQYASYEEAIAAAREFALDWIAQQPVE